MSSLAIQSDGKILVGGDFTTLGGQPRNYIGRLNNTEPATQDLTYAGSTITWLRGGTSPEVWRTTFEHSPNGVTWTSLGAGARVPGGWQLTGVSLPPSGTIRARSHVTGGYNNASAWFAEAYFGAPILISQPTSRTNEAGTTATFSVVAGGTELLSYQWRFYGTNLAGQTSASLVLTGVTTNQAGPYTVVVTNASGSVTSSVATLTVVPSLGEALDNPNLTWTTGGNAPWFAQTSVTHDGVDAAQSGNIGESQQSYLETTVSGPGTLTFWWRWDSEMFFDFLMFYMDGKLLAVPSQSSTWEHQSLTVSNGVHTVRWFYEMLSDFGIGPAWLDQVSFVPEGPSIPIIAVQPQSQTVPVGAEAFVTVTATGADPLSYRWQKNGIPLTDGGNVFGTGADWLTVLNVQTSGAGNYRVVITNAYGSVTSQVATLTVTVSQIPPAITLQPQSRTNLVGTTATFSIAAVGTEPLAYQWRFNGTDLSGATATALTLISVQTTDAGDYIVVITNAYGSIISRVASLTVTNCVPPTNTMPPLPLAMRVGESVSFSCIATGTEPLSYQWRFNGTELPGATSTNLALMNIQLADAGEYDVCVTNACGSATGMVAYLSVTQPGVPASITAQPQSRTNVAGTTATFTVTATGTAPLRYQWLKNSTRLVNTGNILGATTANLTLTNVQLVDAGDYQVIVTNAFGAVTSVVAMLAVTGCAPPTITTLPASLTGCAGEPATFSVTAAGTSLTYQWRKDGAVLSGATKSNYSLAAVAASDAGSYDCLVSNACGAAGMSQNLAQNPGFEEGTSGWFALGAGSLTATTSRAHSGSRSAYVQGRTDTWNGVAQSLLGVVQPSATHLIGVWVWVEGGANQTVNLTVKQSDGGGATYRNVASATLAPGQWKQLVGGFTLAVFGTLTELTLYAEGPAAGVNFYADDFVVQPLVGSSQNLTQNPGFEQGTAGWSALGANLLTATASPVHSGSKSAYVQGRTDTWNGLQQALLGVVQPSIVYRNGAWVRLDGAGDQPVRLKFTQTDSAGTTWPEIASGTANSTTWTHLIGEFALNAYGTLTELNLYIEGPAAGVNFYADDFVVEPLVATTEGPAPAATLTVNSPPTITAQPAGVTRNNGDAVTFSVTASGAGLTYQWRKGGTNITEATGSNYTITAVAAGDVGSYDCVVSGACGLPVTSQAATLAVNSPPSITGQPSGATKNLGHSVTFSVAATGTGLTYQWRKGGVNIGGDCSGACWGKRLGAS